MQTLQESDMKKSSRITYSRLKGGPALPQWRYWLCLFSCSKEHSSRIRTSPAPACCKAVLCLQLLQFWLSGGAGQHLNAPVLESTHLGNLLFFPLCFDRSPTAFYVFQEPGTGGLEGKSVPAVIYDAANFCLVLVASVDHDLISNNVLDHWSFIQAGRRWEGSLGTDLEDL